MAGRRDKRLFTILNKAKRLESTGDLVGACTLYTYYKKIGGKRVVPILSNFITGLSEFTYDIYKIMSDGQTNSSILHNLVKSIACNERLGIQRVDETTYVIWTGEPTIPVRYTIEIQSTPRGVHHGIPIRPLLSKLVHLVAVSRATKDQTITSEKQIESIVNQCINLIYWIHIREDTNEEWDKWV